MNGDKRILFNQGLYCSYHFLFFSLDGKEPKDQDYQEKSENSTVRSTKILKLSVS
jgi:hypothetical protein